MALKITHAEHMRGITHIKHAPEPRSSVVFAGRSNVGKSSLINRLINRKQLARTSKTPGRTQEIHYYMINDRFYFIDLPGYGYAKVSKTIRRTWSPMMRNFFRLAENIHLVVLILDIRRNPTPEDQKMINWLEVNMRPYIFAVTKVDKLSETQRNQEIVRIRQQLKLEDDSALVPVSSVTGSGTKDLMHVIHTALNTPVEKEVD
jgi:GTP-binding protein